VVRALSIGPAASLALATVTGTLRVHSVFSSTVNLEAEGGQRFISLCGPRGGSFPHAVVLERPQDFTTWRLAIGMPARLAAGSLELPVEGRTVVVDLKQAKPWPWRTLPAIPRLGKAHRACTTRLAETQYDATCDLRIDWLWRAGGATTALAERLCNVALALGTAARATPLLALSPSRRCVWGTPLEEAVAALMGLGAGLTPSGDDFLCGFMAAARVADPRSLDASLEHGRHGGGYPALVDALNDAAENNVWRTGTISAFLVRCAIEGFWPTPLVDLAEALSREHEAEALLALDELCGLGHSSGSDIATGLLFGLESLVPHPQGQRAPTRPRPALQ
jgi:Protein of unknown function (DUF2877)